MNAAADGHHLVAQLLLAAGADVNAANKEVSLQEWQGSSAMLSLFSYFNNVVVSSCGSTSCRHSIALRRLHSSSIERQATKHSVCKAGCICLVLYLQGRTALICASEEGHPEVAKVLLHAGADVGASNIVVSFMSGIAALAGTVPTVQQAVRCKLVRVLANGCCLTL